MKHLFVFILCLIVLPACASAQQDESDSGGLVPAKQQASDGKTIHAPVINLTPDKSELIRLEESASSVIIGNPAHASVLMDNPKLLVVVPRQPGATHFSVLNDEGKVIVQRNVIVASPQSNYVRVRRSCGAETDECQEFQSYFCPGLCHEIIVAEDPQQGQSTGSSPAPAMQDANDIPPQDLP